MASKLAIALLFGAIACAAELRIGVLGLFRPQSISVRSSHPLSVQTGSGVVLLEPGQSAKLQGAGSEVDLFTTLGSSTSKRIAIAGRAGGPERFRIVIEGKIDREYNGRLEVTASDSRIESVVSVELEQAVTAVVASEMPRDTPLEALKAMAVLARSYYLGSNRRHEWYDFCDTTHCQWRRETIEEGHPAARATHETKGIVVTHSGAIVAAMYHASCGGRTMSADEVGLNNTSYAYSPIECAPCRRTATWKRQLPVTAITSELLNAPSEMGRLRINRQLGSQAVPSNSYEIHQVGPEIHLEGRGSGHGVGVCQHGIISLARDGVDFRALLTRYLPLTRTAAAGK